MKKVQDRVDKILNKFLEGDISELNPDDFAKFATSSASLNKVKSLCDRLIDAMEETDFIEFGTGAEIKKSSAYIKDVTDLGRKLSDPENKLNMPVQDRLFYGVANFIESINSKFSIKLPGSEYLMSQISEESQKKIAANKGAIIDTMLKKAPEKKELFTELYKKRNDSPGHSR